MTRLSCNFVNVYTKIVNVYTNMADNDKTLMILTWFSSHYMEKTETGLQRPLFLRNRLKTNAL